MSKAVAMRGRDAAKRRTIIRDTRGAVYVEFLATFFPILLFFLALVQLCFIWAADLIVKHAASNGARQAIVSLTDPTIGGNLYSFSGTRRTQIENAVRYPIRALGNPSDADIALTGGGSKDALVTVTVTYDYPCRVPGGSWMACGGATKTLEAESTLPNQGADYIF
jgi:Flp pilus assembly protein TadG